MKNQPNKEEIAAELERIRADGDGILQPEAVVSAAEDDESILHPCFTWDDGEAGRQFRLWQARQLIRITVSIIGNGSPHTVRTYVSLHHDRQGEGGGYRALVDVLADADLRESLLEEALAELKVFQQKYRVLKELAPVFAAARKVAKRQGHVA